MIFEIGSRVGDYKIVGVLGTGGGGRLFKGRHMVTGRVEALKVLQTEREDAPEWVGRFLREIRLQASLDHPNIACVHNAFQEDGRLVMAMELIEGRNLRQIVDAGQVDLADAVRYACQALDALGYAHSRQVTHRDVKPENILVGPDGRVKITDFGLAKIWSGLSLTQTSAPLGSLRYMSPEQVRASKKLDGRSDLYSLGVVLYELVTGRVPFDDENPFDLMKAHVERPPRPPMELREIPGELNGAILGAIQKEPHERYATAEEFREVLERVPLTAREAVARRRERWRMPKWRSPWRLPEWRPTWRLPKRLPKAAVAAAAVVAAGLSLAAVALWPREQAPIPPPGLSPVVTAAVRPPAFAYEKPVRAEEPATAPAPAAAPARRAARRPAAPPPKPEVVNAEPAVEETEIAAVTPPPMVREPAPVMRSEPIRQTPAPAEVAPEVPGLRLLRSWQADGPAERVVFSADGNRLATFGRGGFRVWDARLGGQLQSGDGQVTAVAFAGDGRLFTGNTDGTVRIVEPGADSDTGMLGHASSVTSLWVGADGTVVVAGLQDRSVHLWRMDLASGRYERTERLKGARQPPVSVAFAAKSGLLAAVSRDDQLPVWRESGDRLARIPVLKGGASAVAFAPGGNVVAAAGHGEVGLWHVHSQQQILNLVTGGARYAISFLEGGRCVGVASEGRTVAVWDVLASRLLAKVGADAPVRDVSVGAEGTRVAAVDTEGHVHVWQLNQAAQDVFSQPLDPGEVAALLEEVAGEAERKKGPLGRLIDVLR